MMKLITMTTQGAAIHPYTMSLIQLRVIATVGTAFTFPGFLPRLPITMIKMKAPADIAERTGTDFDQPDYED